MGSVSGDGIEGDWGSTYVVATALRWRRARVVSSMVRMEQLVSEVFNVSKADASLDMSSMRWPTLCLCTTNHPPCARAIFISHLTHYLSLTSRHW
jgi:hypothetical protein